MASWGIPTWHDGVLFRSRSEARWAVFFDRLDLKWVYEPQGYVTDGTCYLPDFLVFTATGTIWAEVKPDLISDQGGIGRFQQFVLDRPKPSRAVLLAGQPEVEGYVTAYGGDIDAENPGNGPWEDDCQAWRPCPSGYHFDVCYPGKYWSKFAEDGCSPVPGNPGEDRIAMAVSAAKSARFKREPPSGSAA
jgi:hypothetical protein